MPPSIRILIQHFGFRQYKLPLHGYDYPPTLDIRQTVFAKHRYRSHGARHRNVEAFAVFAAPSSALNTVDMPSSPECLYDLVENWMRFASESSSVISRSGLTIFMTSPEKPAPVPTSITRLFCFYFKNLKPSCCQEKCLFAMPPGSVMAVRFIFSFQRQRSPRIFGAFASAFVESVNRIASQSVIISNGIFKNAHFLLSIFKAPA